MSSLTARLCRAASSDAAVTGWDREPTRLPYAALLERARRVAGGLRERGVEPGQPVVLQLADPLPFLVGFWGALLADAVPVPVTPAGHRDHRERLQGACRLTRARGGIADARHADALRACGIEAWDLEELDGPLRSDPRRTGDDPAWIQFSSGSTGSPRGVVLTHRNALACLDAMAERLGARPDDVSLSWMPLTHDLGLVGFHLLPLSEARDAHLMRPASFLQRPASWLDLAERTRATALASPCFGLEWLLSKTGPERRWDLGAVRALFIGSDPVSVEIVERFLARVGLDPSVAMPVYGLAEATLGVTFPDPGDGLRTQPIEGRTLVDLGRPLACCEVAAIDEAGTPVPDGTVGEIAIQGPSVSPGYVGEPARVGPLRTGDLGVRIGGRWFVVGRRKEIAFVLGQNVYLPDVDRAVAEELGLEAAAFLVEREAVAVAVKRLQDRADEVAALVYRRFGLRVAGIVDVRSLPRTPSGKLERHALVLPEVDRVLAVLRSAAPSLGADDGFLEAGISSVALAEIAARIEAETGLQVRDVDLFAHPTPRRLALALSAPASRRPRRSGREDEPIAIVSLAARIGAAASAAELHQRLLAGDDLVGPLPEARRADLFAQTGSRVEPEPGGYLPRVDLFDPAAFGLSERQGSLLHPAHRLLLELGADALHGAGPIDGARTGVYVGALGDLEGTQYREWIAAAAPDLLGLCATGNLGAFLAGRLSYRFDLRGPALVVDTACSASLAAVHLAAQALRADECDVAVAGSARVQVRPSPWPAQIGFESRSGRCRAFDERADGIVFGEGGAALVLKRLRDVGPDDRIEGVLLGSAMSSGGRAAGLTAPNPLALAEAVREAWRRSGIAARDLAFVEAHGAGTPLSDAVEVEALRLAAEGWRGALPIGSVKSNVGHLFEAAGLAGLVKAVEALRDRRLPPTLHCANPNPKIRWDVVRPANAAEELAEGALCAAVTSIGFSGTQVHLVLRSSDRPSPRPPAPSWSRVRCWVEPAGPAGSGDALARLTAAISRYGGVALAPGDERRDLFELGLDSIALVQIRQALQRELGIELPLARLFDDLRTPEALAAHIASPTSPVRSAPPVHDLAGPSNGLVRALNERFASSKVHTDLHRPHLANNRATAGFRPAWKETVFPVVAGRASGAWIEDLDGRRLLDLTMGFGVHLFGHAPSFVHDAVREALAAGAPLGPLSPLAGDVAARLARLCGVERAAFFNSGTEAVMVAMRLARAVTGRRKIAAFAGSYHGSFDGVLGLGGVGGTFAFAAGTPPGMVEDLVVLEYGQPASLDALWERRDELAAVLVEPVQSRRPDRVPIPFLRELRELCSAMGSALLFDEIVTGFRVHPGGAAARFGVRPDLVTYGKVLGGGFPIGVVAGSARFLDPIDGGAWRFGDDSGPRVDQTFVAGTFCHHPVALAAARAVLARIEADGPALQEGLDARTEAVCQRLDAALAPAGIETVRFSSWFRLKARDPHALESLYAELLREGVYVWEGRNCFWSTAHGEAEANALVAACAAAAGRLGSRLPLTPGRQGGPGRVADVQALAVALDGPLDPERLRAAIGAVVGRHPITRARALDGGAVLGAEPCVDVGETPSLAPFGAEGPFLRFAVDGPDLWLVTHRALYDGYSMGLLLAEIGAWYGGEGLGEPLPPPPPPPARPEPSGGAHVARHLATSHPAARWALRARERGTTRFGVLAATVAAAVRPALAPTWWTPAVTPDRVRYGVGAATSLVPLGALDGPDADREAVAAVARALDGLVGPVAQGPVAVVNLDPVPRVAFGGLRARWLPVALPGTAWPLVVSAIEVGDRVEIDWKHAPDLCDGTALAAAVERFGATWEDL